MSLVVLSRETLVVSLVERHGRARQHTVGIADDAAKAAGERLSVYTQWNHRQEQTGQHIQRRFHGPSSEGFRQHEVEQRAETAIRLEQLVLRRC
jgi:hypothetical protein